jgi:hypothetical protein
MKSGDLATQIAALATMMRNLEEEWNSAREDFLELLQQWEQEDK